MIRRPPRSTRTDTLVPCTTLFRSKTPAQLQALGDFDLECQGRVTTPVLYESTTGKFRAIDWDEAYAVAVRELTALAPETVAFYASGRSSNEAAFLWQLAARAYGSPNLPDSSNLCHESSGYAPKHSIGTGKGTCSLEDFEIGRAECRERVCQDG